MKTVVIGAAISSTSSHAAVGRHLRRAARSRVPLLRRLRGLPALLGYRKEALENRLQEFALELLAAIVLIAIFMVVTDPATRNDC